MKCVAKLIIGAVWVAGAVCLCEFRGWSGLGCIILSIPGVVCFITGTEE